MAVTAGGTGRDADSHAERELADALGLQAAAREVSYAVVMAGVLVMGMLAVLLVSSVAALPRRVAPSHEPSLPVGELRHARALYEQGSFAASRAAFAALGRRFPDSARVRDYLARLTRIDADAAAIARARGRLALGDAVSALGLAREVADNSPLYPDAWALSNRAQEELSRAALAAAQAEREARALADAQSAAAEAARFAAEADPAALRRQKRRDRRTQRAKRDDAGRVF
jgi:hypothetical protein